VGVEWYLIGIYTMGFLAYCFCQTMSANDGITCQGLTDTVA